MQVRATVIERVAELLAADPGLPKRSLSELNAQAVKLSTSGDSTGSLATYRVLFTRASQLNLTHPELYVCHSNYSAACLKVELFEEALEHAGHAARLAEASLRRYLSHSALKF